MKEKKSEEPAMRRMAMDSSLAVEGSSFSVDTGGNLTLLGRRGFASVAPGNKSGSASSSKARGELPGPTAEIAHVPILAGDAVEATDGARRGCEGCATVCYFYLSRTFATWSATVASKMTGWPKGVCGAHWGYPDDVTA